MPNWEYITETSRLQQLVPAIMEKKAWGADTETTGLCFIKNHPILFQLGRPEVQYLIDTRKVSLEPLRPMLESEEYYKIGHNLKFDYMMLAWNHDIRMERLRDCFLAEKILLNGLQDWGFGLDDLMHKYLKKTKDVEMQKSFINHTGDFTERQLNYAAADVADIMALEAKQYAALKEKGLSQTYILENNCVPCFGDMEMHGVRLKQDTWMEIANEHLAAAKEIEPQMDTMARMFDWPTDIFGKVDINYSSPEQVVDLLKRMGVKVVQTRQDGTQYEEIIKNSNSKTFKKLKSNKFVELMTKYRKHMKAYTTYGQNFIDAIYDETGRIHSSINQLGAETGRITSGEKRYAPEKQVNLLNIPRDKRMRHCFLAYNDDYVVETDDYSGAELRIWAHISQDPGLMEIFLNGLDAHCVVASKLYRQEVGPKDPLRTPAKSLNFGIAYGMAAFSLYERLNGDGFPISLPEAQALYKTYCTEYAVGVSYLRDAGKFARENGYLCNINGRIRNWRKPDPMLVNKKGVRVFPKGIYDPKYRGVVGGIEREGGNYLIQSVNADITKYGMTLIRRHTIKNKIRSNIMMQVYDEIVTDTHKNDSPDFVIKKRQLMREAAERWITTVPFEVDGHVKDTWTK